jgi:Ni,Fe-hydrogenase III large subunit/NADH:ubiquinone oxidoreductase subunit C
VKPAWYDGLYERLLAEGAVLSEVHAPGLEPAHGVALSSEDWGTFGRQAKQWGLRFAATWAEDRGEVLVVHALFERDGAYLAARTHVDKMSPVLPSQTPHFPGANRLERHIQDLYGVVFGDHPDARRWTRHQAWKDAEYPLRKDYPAAGRSPAPTPGDHGYRFLHAHGAGVYEIPVGPVHAGIIEPGHFRFQAVGETVLHLEERLGYVHKGIEKVAEGRTADALARLAGRVSGDTTVGHAWAACMAMERAAGVEIPARALNLRAIMAERERVANHLGDIGAIANDVAFSFGFYQFARLREQWCRASAHAFGHRFMMDRVVPGGVGANLADDEIDHMEAEIRALRAEVESLMRTIGDSPTLEDRLVTTGELSPELAATLGTLGYVARASGQTFDLRHDAPYAPYDRLTVEVPVYRYGDIAARVRVRAEEIRVSCALIEQLLQDLPGGPVRAPWPAPRAGAEGLGLVEGWRGEIVAFVRFGDNGKIERYFPRDPSAMNWPALELLIHGNIVPDFPVCNKSVNGSYSGSDL